MKRVILVRHATAVERGPRGSDFHRRLRKRGRREAAVMADRVAGIIGVPDLLITSPADRALETAHAFADRLAIARDAVVVREELYGGLLAEELLSIVQATDDTVESVAYFGHDPSFTEFAAFLVPGFAARLPRAGVVVVDIDRASWQDVHGGDGTLVAFESPPPAEELKRNGQEIVDRLAIGVRAAMLEALRAEGVGENREVVKAVVRASERVAEVARPYARVGSGDRSREKTADDTRLRGARKAARKS